jgi:Zn-dependent protease with chaperone function
MSRITRRSAWLTASAAVALLVAVPLSVRAQVLGLSEPDEIAIGRRVAAEIEFDQPLVNDGTVLDYVERLGLRLARASERSHLRYRFRVLDSDDVNAFVLPGGFVYVTRGLLESADSDGEVAGVVAHEIGHVVGRHHASRLRRDRLAALGLSLLGPAFGGGVTGLVTRQAGRVGVQGLFQRFSREQEREADRLAVMNVHEVGYDPRGLVTFFERLSTMRQTRPGRLERFFASHPSPEERADNVSDLLQTLEPPRRSPPTAALARVQARLAELRPAASESTSAAVAALLEATEEEAESPEARQREIAALYAPLFYQALGPEPRYDYITNFDFDDDWRGDNNWDHAANKKWPLKAWVYYHVRETATHYFIHYAAFHPRDYKGGSGRGRWFSRAIRGAVARVGTNDPTGRAQELVLAHENDLEGCLIVVEKRGDDPASGRLRFIETMAHNAFLKYTPETEPGGGASTVPVSGRRAKLYVEPKGHGIEGYRGDDAQLGSAEKGFRLYAFTGHAEEQPGNSGGSDTVGYDLVPLGTTLWPLALQGITATYAETEDYGTMLISAVNDEGGTTEHLVRLGQVGSAFRGTIGGENLARPPWAWFDGRYKGEPLGQWYFDPARTIRDHFELGETFSVAYVSLDLLTPPPSSGSAVAPGSR